MRRLVGFIPLFVFLFLPSCRESNTRERLDQIIAKNLEAKLYVSRNVAEQFDDVDAMIFLRNKSSCDLEFHFLDSGILRFSANKGVLLKAHGEAFVDAEINTHMLGTHKVSSIELYVKPQSICRSMVSYTLYRIIERLDVDLYSLDVPIDPVTIDIPLAQKSFLGIRIKFYEASPFSWLYYLVLFFTTLSFVFLSRLFVSVFSSKGILSRPMFVTFLCLLSSLAAITCVFSSYVSIVLLGVMIPSFPYLAIVFVGSWLVLFTLDMFSVTRRENIIVDNLIVNTVFFSLSVLVVTCFWSGRHLIIERFNPYWLLAAVLMASVMRVLLWREGH